MSSGSNNDGSNLVAVAVNTVGSHSGSRSSGSHSLGSTSWWLASTSYVWHVLSQSATHRAQILPFLGRNLVTMLAVLASGIVMWESSTEELIIQMSNSAVVVFPLYLPHAVATSMAAIFRNNVVAPGNLLGFYLVREFMTLRRPGMLTSFDGSVLALILLATLQSHVCAFYLQKCLCKGDHDELKKKLYPTIDTVADAMCFVAVVTVTTVVFSTLQIALFVSTITPKFWQVWSTWWLGVLAATITVTPLVVHVTASWKSWNHVKVVVTAGIALGLLSVVFFLDNLQAYFRPMPYLCFPLITYTALRFTRVGWAVAVTAVAFSCAVGSVHRRGAVHAIVGKPAPWNTQLILQVQLFSIVMGVVSITLAAAVREKKSLTRRLHQMNRDLECTVECRTRQLLKINEELQISQKKAEMASRAKSDFLANMSHEIRTPIHGILGLTALLLESEPNVDQKESLVSVKECTDLLLHIINSVLDLAKIEAGRLEVETVPFNVRKLVSSTFRMMQARAQERGLKLHWDVDRAVPPALAGDVGKLQQCLINLVGNALKFTHEGSVSMHVRVASDSLIASRMNALHGPNVLSSSTMSDYESLEAYTRESMFIHFEVCDTGIGIHKEKLKDMFKPFTQADASTSRLYGGTGLGLCIVHRFVELLGGTIWVESEVGKGSALHFCLPLLLTTSKAASAESSPRVKSPSPAGKVFKKPWRGLLNGLVFHHPGPEYYTGANDRLQKGADHSTVISIDDLSAHVSRKKESYFLSLNNGRGRPRNGVSTQNFNSQLSIKTDLASTRGRRSSNSDYEAFKELRSARRGHLYYGNPRPHGWNCKDWLELQSLPPLKTAGGFEDVSVSEGQLAHEESERDTVAGTSDSPAASDLSRASESTELESLLLENKLQLKILLAEDNPINQKVASRQLQKHGHIVTIVGDGQQALDTICAQHDQFDLVLMDVQMPIMDGLAATEKIRMAEMEKGWSRVPIMGLTAHAIQGYQDTCLIHGMDGYLRKPFDIQQLLKTIGHMLPQE